MVNRYSLFTAVVEATEITQMQDLRIRPNVQQANLTPGGLVDRAHVAIGAGNPVIEFSTKDLTTIFGAISITIGLDCPNGATFRGQQRKSADTFWTGAKHETWVSTAGHLIPGPFGASQDDVNGATIQMRYYPLSSDGLTAPITHNTTVDFDAVTDPAFVSRFFLGPVVHNGTAITNINAWSCDPMLQFDTTQFDGLPYPTQGAITLRDPVFTFTCADMSEGNGVVMWGAALAGNLDFYLRKGVADGARVANATLEHVRVRVSAGNWDVQESSIVGNEDGSTTFRATPTGTISVVTNAAIP